MSYEELPPPHNRGGILPQETKIHPPPRGKILHTQIIMHKHNSVFTFHCEIFTVCVLYNIRKMLSSLGLFHCPTIYAIDPPPPPHCHMNCGKKVGSSTRKRAEGGPILWIFARNSRGAQKDNMYYAPLQSLTSHKNAAMWMKEEDCSIFFSLSS